MIVGLAGQAECGKSTVASTLVRHMGMDRGSFAQEIRTLLRVCSSARITDYDLLEHKSWAIPTEIRPHVDMSRLACHLVEGGYCLGLVSSREVGWWPNLRSKVEAELRRGFSDSVTTYRDLMKLVGMVARDTVHEDYWVESLKRRIVGMDPVVIDDVRFPNEVEWIFEAGGVVIRVNRIDQRQSGDEHITETALDRMSLPTANAKTGDVAGLVRSVVGLIGEHVAECVANSGLYPQETT